MHAMDKTLDLQANTSIDTISGLTYSYRPRMMGADYAFRLASQTLDWDIGKRAGQIPYRDVVRIRLSFRPANLAGSRFVTEIWSREGIKLLIASVSMRSLFDFENRGPAYRDFVAKLCRRASAENPGCRLETGFPKWRWWPAMIVGVVAFLAALYLCVSVLLSGELGVGAALTAFGLFFGWQIGSMIVRNRPRTFISSEIPRDVLP
jgi:hypothetical protein